jgi:predicted DNA-binding transcriptional regulator
MGQSNPQAAGATREDWINRCLIRDPWHGMSDDDVPPIELMRRLTQKIEKEIEESFRGKR